MDEKTIIQDHLNNYPESNPGKDLDHEAAVSYVATFAESGMDWVLELDSIETGWGDLSEETYREWVEDCADFLLGEGAKNYRQLTQSGIPARKAGVEFTAIRERIGGHLLNDQITEDARSLVSMIL